MKKILESLNTKVDEIYGKKANQVKEQAKDAQKKNK